MRKTILTAVMACAAIAAAAQTDTAAGYTDWEKWQVADNGQYSLYFVENFDVDTTALMTYRVYDDAARAGYKTREDAFRAVFKDHPGAYESFLRSELVYYDAPDGVYNPTRFTVSFPVSEWSVMRPISQALGRMNDMADSDDGFFALLTYDHNLHRYTLAFRGTDLSWRDAFADISSNLLGNANSQLDKAVKLAALIDALPDHVKERMVITGHSLGGGLASLVSALTGVPADTFNAMGIPAALIDHYAAEMAKATGRKKAEIMAAVPENKSRIRAFATTTDILSRAQAMSSGFTQAAGLIDGLANSIFGEGTVNTSSVALITAEALGRQIKIDVGTAELSDHLYKGHQLKSFMPR